MATFYLPESMGWGNVALCLSDLVGRSPNPRAHKSLLDVDRGVEFSGFEITDDLTEDKFDHRVIINPAYFHHIHSNLPRIIKPNKELEELINKYDHGLDYGIHIRRGACSKDSENVGCHGKDDNGDIKKAYFAKDSAIEKFIKIVENSDSKIFLASDSQDIKDMFKKRFPDTIVTLEHDIVLTYTCDTYKVAKIMKRDDIVEIYDTLAKVMLDKKNIHPNVDYPCGPTYHMIGIDTDFFTPIFVMARITGWSAHIMEQHTANKLIRPLSKYSGSDHREVVLLNQR